MMTISNFTDNAVDEEFLAKVAKIVLKGENEKTKDISVVLVERKKMRELNKKYRKKDRATDVLSFDYGNSGEIVLCSQEIKKNAAKLKISFKKEIARILIHGILHLCGYDHEKSKKETEKMEKKENYYSEQCEESRF